MGRRLALLIATDQYEDAGLRRLTAPGADAEAFAAVLRDPDIAGFDVTMLTNQPYHRVGEAIGDFYRDRRRDDLMLLYFTGHGLKDDDGRLFLAMTNTKRASLLFTSVSAEQIDHAMKGCASRQTVLVLDCCYSGAFPAGRLAKSDTQVHVLERFQGRGRTVLTASDATQYSFEGDQLRGEGARSVFTRYLVEGLADGSADLDGDGDITVDELYTYVHDRVVEDMPQQRPKRLDNVEGRITIARNINWALPPYLRNTLNSPIAADRLSAVDGLSHLYRIGNDAVRDRVLIEIQRLITDDSRAVSAAAHARLSAIVPSLAEPVRDPVQHSVTDVSASSDRLAPQTARPAKSPTNSSGSPALLAQSASPQPGPPDAETPSRVVPRRATHSSPSQHPPADQAGLRPRRSERQILAVVAVVGAVVGGLTVGLFALSSPDTADSVSASPSSAAPTSDAAAGGDGVTTNDDVFGSACSMLPQGDEPGSLDSMGPQPVASAAGINPLLTTLATAVGEVPGLADTLNSQEAITVYAPFNGAFEEVQASLGDEAFNALLANPDELGALLSYHVVPQRYDAEGLIAAGTTTQLVGGEVTVSGTATDDGLKLTSGGGTEATVLCGNIPTSNATVFVIDKVLLPAI